MCIYYHWIRLQDSINWGSKVLAGHLSDKTHHLTSLPIKLSQKMNVCIMLYILRRNQIKSP